MYLKLDKKLILEVDSINIQSSLDSKLTDIKQFDEHILLAPIVLKYFQKINIKNLKINNNNLSIKFDSNKLYFNSNTLVLEAIPHFYAHQIKLDISEFKLKEYNINLDGQITIDINKNKIFYIGDVKYKKQSVKLNLQADEKFVNIYATGNGSIDINLLKDFYRLDPPIEKWLYENVIGSHSLDFIGFNYDILNNKIVDSSIDFNSKIKDAKIIFNDKLQPIFTKNINIKYKNNILNFTFDTPKYRSVSLDDSSLSINNIGTNKQSILNLNLKSNSIINSDIKEILAAYDITLPIGQSSGALDSNLNININLLNDDTSIIGLFQLDKADISVGGLDFKIDTANVILNNNNINVKAINSTLLNDQLNLDINNLNIDTKNGVAHGDIKINSFSLKENKDILDIKNFSTDIGIYFKDDIKIILPKLYTTITNTNFTEVSISDLSKFYNYSLLLSDNFIFQGDLNLKLLENKIILKTNINQHDLPLMIDKLQLNGTIEDNNVNITSIDNKITIKIDPKSTLIKIKDIDIDKSKIITKSNKKSNKNVQINGVNSNIILSNTKKILSNKFLYESNIEGDTNFDLNYNNTKVSFSAIDNNSKINVIDANSEFINSFMGNDDFISSGNININGVANKSDKYLYIGEIVLKDTNFKDFKALNNILTLLQSSSAIANPLLALPTLFRVVKGDLKLNGYQAIEGTIKYAYNHEKQFLNLHDIKTQGAEIDFDGSATIDLNQKIINSELKVIFLKDIVNIGSKIPLVNLVINKKNKIYSTVTINGDLENPETKFILFNP